MKYEKFWMIMQDSTLKDIGLYRPLRKEYDSEVEAVRATMDKVNMNRKSYFVLEAKTICRLRDTPVICEVLTEKEMP